MTITKKSEQLYVWVREDHDPVLLEGQEALKEKAQFGGKFFLLGDEVKVVTTIQVVKEKVYRGLDENIMTTRAGVFKTGPRDWSTAACSHMKVNRKNCDDCRCGENPSMFAAIETIRT